MRLQVSSNGRYFVDQDGKPFFYLGDTAWLIFQRLNEEQVEEYLQDRAGKGFNVLQVYVVRGLEERHPDGPVSLLDASPFLDRDPARPNEAYFRKVDQVIHRANELGMVVALVAAKSWHVNEHPERIFDRESAYTFGKFLGERYRNSGVLWYVGGDSRPGDDGEIWVRMARGLKEGSAGEHLVSYHGSGGTTSSTWHHHADWLDFNSIQSGHPWAAKTYQYIQEDYALTPAKPTVDMEPSYENHPTRTGPRIDSHQVRKGAYWAVLAGAAGHGYGAMDLFYLYQESDGPFPRDGYLSWHEAIQYEGSRQVGLMRRLFELRPWHHLVPDQAVLTSAQPEAEGRIQAARAEDRSFLLAYLPQGGEVSVHLEALSAETLQARWFDPRDGSWREIGQFPGMGQQTFTAPSSGEREDWVLVLEDAAKNYPLELPE